jgi:hypothetical protein
MNPFLQWLMGGAGAGLLGRAYSQLGNVGQQGLSYGQQLANLQQQQAAFRPYTITTPTGAMFTASAPAPTPVGVGAQGFFVDPTSGGDQVDYVQDEPITPDPAEVQKMLAEQAAKREAAGDSFSYEQAHMAMPMGGALDPTMAAPQPAEFGMQLSPQEQQFYQNMFGGAGQFFQQAAMPTADRESAIYERMRALSAPEEELERQNLEQRLAAQGRLGMQTAQFGGAPEQLAMSRAQQQAQQSQKLAAIQQAQAEQAQQAALGQQYLGAAYLPQAQMLNALTPGMTAAGQAQQAQMYGTGLFGEAAASGLDMLLATALGRANLAGSLGGGLLGGALGIDLKDII